MVCWFVGQPLSARLLRRLWNRWLLLPDGPGFVSPSPGPFAAGPEVIACKGIKKSFVCKNNVRLFALRAGRRGKAAMAFILDNGQHHPYSCRVWPHSCPLVAPRRHLPAKEWGYRSKHLPKAPARGGCMPLRLDSRSSMDFCGTNRLCNNRVSCIKTSCNVGITAPCTSCNPFFLLSNVL